MRTNLFDAIVASVCGLGLCLAIWFSSGRSSLKPQPLEPAPVVQPDEPKPDKPKKPDKRRPWRMDEMEAKIGGAIAPDGTEVNCDLPDKLHLKNKGGKDGAGLCVFTSIEHSAIWQNVIALQGFRDWMTKKPGGGYPEKVDAMIAEKCKEAGLPKPDYIQVEGADLEMLKLACRTGRIPSVTYSYSPTGRYGGQRIAHMVSLVHADDRWFAVLDNNFPTEGLEWMTPEEFRKTYLTPDGRGKYIGWSVILLNPGPPPVPLNR